jgi:hypothetical protein
MNKPMVRVPTQTLPKESLEMDRTLLTRSFQVHFGHPTTFSFGNIDKFIVMFIPKTYSSTSDATHNLCGHRGA